MDRAHHNHLDEVQQLHHVSRMMTPFKFWRTEVMNITQAKAAEILGLGVSQVKNLDSGIERGRKMKIEPTLPILKLMNAAAKGYQFEPWQHNNQEKGE